MNALELLKDDHDQVKAAMAELGETESAEDRETLFTDLRRDLEVHEVIEEEIFYPALREHPRAKDIVLEGYEEHHVVDVLLGELSALPFDDEAWGAKAKVMIENVEHHIEEEEGEMFEQARAVFDAAELDGLGERMATRKAAALAERGGGSGS